MTKTKTEKKTASETLIGFSDLGLRPELLQAVQEAGYTSPTPIQQQAIPLALAGRDLIGLAQTGTGKTAGFTLPIIERLLEEGYGHIKAGAHRVRVLANTASTQRFVWRRSTEALAWSLKRSFSEKEST
jgi:superfamily II DNA/RNA helicase